MGELAPFYFVDIRGRRYSRELPPNECPVCHYSIHAEELSWTLATEGDDAQAILESVFKCPRRECGHLFIGRYWRDDVLREGLVPGFLTVSEFRLREAVPATPMPSQIPVEVSDVSPSFVEIHSQASVAEALGLDQISGVGYRKSLEFLVKDYCISAQPEHADAIRTVKLAQCISQFVDDPQIVRVARRAAWLGNDETHYQRRWDAMDIENLKQLIQLTVNWIHSSLLTAKYQMDMPD